MNATLTEVTLERHAYNLGSLIANFQSLEFMLRVVLTRLPGAQPLGIPLGVDLYSFAKGEEVPENDLTSYDSLSVLIAKYNKAARERKWPELDTTIVEVRDAVAHGRVSAPMKSDVLRLLKFSKPRSGKVTVMFNELLSEEWFSMQRKRSRDAMLSVNEAFKELVAEDGAEPRT